MHHTIQDVMTSNPTTIQPTTSAQDAARTMKSEDVGSLPIVENDRLTGVVTDRDLALRVLGEGRGGETPVAEIASKDVVTVDPQQSLEEAARLMAEHQVRRLPAGEKEGSLFGSLAKRETPRSGNKAPPGGTVSKTSN